MFNVTVINIKDSVKHIISLVAILIVILVITRVVAKIKTNEILQINLSERLIYCLSVEIPALAKTQDRANFLIKEDGEEFGKSSIERILGIELSKIKGVEIDENDEEEIGQQEEVKGTEENTNNVIDSAENSETHIVTQNPISESYNVEINGVKVKNETTFEINENILAKELSLNKEDVLIFHTHTCESYTPSEQYQYQQTGNFRTTDLNFSVSRVGDELLSCLNAYGINTYHDKTYHDYPAYTGSYNRSKETVENALKTNPSDIIIDLHRDAIGSKSNYDPSVQIGEDVAAQLMFVIGTNGGGLYHPEWQSNLKFALEIQQKANELYPGLFKPIIVRNSRYNQHLGKAACIIEVGATGNTMEQCLTSMKYLAKVFDEYRK